MFDCRPLFLNRADLTGKVALCCVTEQCTHEGCVKEHKKMAPETGFNPVGYAVMVLRWRITVYFSLKSHKNKLGKALQGIISNWTLK